MMKIIKSKKIILLLTAAVLLFVFFYCENNIIGKTYISYGNDKIPEAFKGYKIVHISDLHNKEFGKNQSALLDMIEEEKPDIIVVTGDSIDCRKTNIDIAMEFIDGALKIAPVYFVTGNHEYNIPHKYEIFRERLIESGAVVLENEAIEITGDSQTINIYGISDHGNYSIDSTLDSFDIDKSEFNILLSHRPELLETYSEYGFDLVFTGHAHGGQIRIPCIGGVIAPNQGLFPEYTEGIHTIGETSEIISRGLGNSIAPVRAFNRPEIIICVFE